MSASTAAQCAHPLGMLRWNTLPDVIPRLSLHAGTHHAFADFGSGAAFERWASRCPCVIASPPAGVLLGAAVTHPLCCHPPSFLTPLPLPPGFCILNDLAITAELLLHQGRVQRVLILDLDVHQVGAAPVPTLPHLCGCHCSLDCKCRVQLCGCLVHAAGSCAPSLHCDALPCPPPPPPLCAPPAGGRHRRHLCREGRCVHLERALRRQLPRPEAGGWVLGGLPPPWCSSMGPCQGFRV